MLSNQNSNASIEEKYYNQIDQEYPFEVHDINFPITTSSQNSQKWFERGLLQCYTFNHEEAIYCCDKALEFDSECPLVYFLKSFALGINYNNYPEKLDPLQAKLQYENCQKALKFMEKATDLEKQLILALSLRVGDGITLTHDNCDKKFSQKMKEIYEEHSDNEYVVGIYVESMMNLSPWNFWVQTPKIANGNQKYGDPCFEKTLEIKHVLEIAMTKFPNNLGLRHFWVHFMESSSTPEVALESCFKNKINDIAKDYSHLLHTPSHIDLVLGQYNEAIEKNELAVQANNKYFQWREKINKPVVCFNTYYRVHASHFIAYSAMLSGNYRKAVQASKDMIRILPECVLSDTQCFKPSGGHWCESYLPTLLHVYIRFGKWEEIISKEPFGLDILPMDQVISKPDIYIATNCTIQYARGIAYAVLAGSAKQSYEQNKCLQESEKCLKILIKLIEKIPIGWKLLKNAFKDIMNVGVEMLQGEYFYRIEEYDQAFKHLRKSVEIYDLLNYDEPWGWMMPTRHPLGALLLEYGVLKKDKNAILEAIKSYKEDLGEIAGIPMAITHPYNLWSLLGLIQCYKQLNIIEKQKVVENNIIDLVQKKFDEQMIFSDLKIKSSCFCTIKNLF